MFLGEFEHALDAKGRVIIPSKFRDEIGEQKLVITPGLDKNLVVYTEEGFRDYAEHWLELSTGKANYRKLRRYVAANAEHVELDRQGRILISSKLRERAGLVRDVVVSGNLSNFEIWSPEAWKEASEFGDDSEIARQIEELDIRI